MHYRCRGGVSTHPTLIWIDNTAVLERANNSVVGDNSKNHLVLDYDLWRSMVSLINLIQTPIQWGKVNSHIEGNIFKEDSQPKRGGYSIRLNKVVDGWAWRARESHRGPYPYYLYPESEVMVQWINGRFIYGDISKVITNDINREKMFKNLWGKNRHWDDVIFESIDWEEGGTCMKNMARKLGTMVTNVLKLVHVWQNDNQQKELFYEDVSPNNYMAHNPITRH